MGNRMLLTCQVYLRRHETISKKSLEEEKVVKEDLYMLL